MAKKKEESNEARDKAAQVIQQLLGAPLNRGGDKYKEVFEGLVDAIIEAVKEKL